MVEAVLHFLKIHRKMIFGNPAIIVQNMLRKTPKTLNTVDMVLGFLVDQRFRVVDGEVLPQPFQGIVASEGVGVVDRSFPGFLSDNGHELLFRHMLHHGVLFLVESNSNLIV